MTAPKKSAKRSAVKPTTFTNPTPHKRAGRRSLVTPGSDAAPPPNTAPKAETPRQMADRFLLRLVRQRGHELIRIHQARQIGTHDDSAEVAEDVYTECFDAIAIERAASRDELDYERAQVSQ